MPDLATDNQILGVAATLALFLLLWLAAKEKK